MDNTVLDKIRFNDLVEGLFDQYVDPTSVYVEPVVLPSRLDGYGGVSPVISKIFVEGHLAGEIEYWVEQRRFVLNYLGIHPDYQRRGVAEIALRRFIKSLRKNPLYDVILGLNANPVWKGGAALVSKILGPPNYSGDAIEIIPHKEIADRLTGKNPGYGEDFEPHTSGIDMMWSKRRIDLVK